MKTQTTIASKIIFKTWTFLIFLLLSYNSFGATKIYSTLTETWVNNSWQNSTLDLNTYQGTDLSKTVHQIWVVSSNSWLNDSQSFYTYTGVNLTQIISQTWDATSNLWDNTQRLTFTYLAPNKNLTTVIETWAGGNWVNSFKEVNSYDGSQYLISSVFQSWVVLSATWQNTLRYLYTNNAAGFPTQQVFQLWDNTASVWKNYLRFTNTYDANNNELTQLTETWVAPTSTWLNTQRVTNTFNANNEVLTTVTEIWVTDHFVNSTKELNTYNGSNHITNGLFQTWNSLTNVFDNDNQSNYAYDASGNLFQIVAQTWNVGASAWNNSQRITYGFVPLAVRNFTNENAFVTYPNPAKDVLYLQNKTTQSVDKIMITDLSGKVVAEQNGNTTQVNVQQLQQGLYLLQVFIEGSNYNYKFLKQ